jgi:hypothetical protein
MITTTTEAYQLVTERRLAGAFAAVCGHGSAQWGAGQLRPQPVLQCRRSELGVRVRVRVRVRGWLG